MSSTLGPCSEGFATARYHSFSFAAARHCVTCGAITIAQWRLQRRAQRAPEDKIQGRFTQLRARAFLWCVMRSNWRPRALSRMM